MPVYTNVFFDRSVRKKPYVFCAYRVCPKTARALGLQSMMNEINLVFEPTRYNSSLNIILTVLDKSRRDGLITSDIIRL